MPFYEKPDNLARISGTDMAYLIDTVDGSRINALGVVHRLKFLCGDVIQKAVAVASGVHVKPDHLMQIVQTQGLRQRSAWKVQGGNWTPCPVQEEPVVSA